MKAIRIQKTGGREVMQLAEVPLPEPGPGEVRVRLGAAGVNFIDIYRRIGLYPVELPHTLGLEGAGSVESVGPGVRGLAQGDRVAFADAPGTYAEQVVLPADRAVRLPDAVTDEQGAAAMLQGMTAHYLAMDTYPIRRGDTVLIHAGAGGVGGLLIQLAHRLGARVLTTASTPEKAAAARESGADETILYTEQDFEAETRRLTGGKGVQAVYDSVGRTTFLKSLRCLAPRGMLVSFGQSSGSIEPIDPGLLGRLGSLYLTRPSLFHYVADPQSLQRRAGEVLGWVADGSLRLTIGLVLPLEQAAEAHRRLEARETVGKVLLTP
ncbi:MAG: quinone oxidoreductase [Spirochaetales bacterium]|nr:quinone oxidoreductase [Spirochaetales bacterium]